MSLADGVNGSFYIKGQYLYSNDRRYGVYTCSFAEGAAPCWSNEITEDGSLYQFEDIRGVGSRGEDFVVLTTMYNSFMDDPPNIEKPSPGLFVCSDPTTLNGCERYQEDTDGNYALPEGYLHREGTGFLVTDTEIMYISWNSATDAQQFHFCPWANLTDPSCWTSLEIVGPSLPQGRLRSSLATTCPRAPAKAASAAQVGSVRTFV